MTDSSKLILFSGRNAFKNNAIYTGNFTITGSIAQAAGSIYTQTVPLNSAPDLINVQFYITSSTDYPSAWAEYGDAQIVGNDAANGYSNYDYVCILGSYISGNNVVLTASFNNQFLSSPTLTTTNIPYRIVDYSVF